MTTSFAPHFKEEEGRQITPVFSLESANEEPRNIRAYNNTALQPSFRIAHDDLGAIQPHNDNDTTLTDIWNETDTSGMGALVMVLQPTRSLDNTIKAIKALIDQGEPQRAHALLEKVIDRYEAKGEIERVLERLDDNGLSYIVSMGEDLTPSAATLITHEEQLDEEERLRQHLLDQAPKFAAF